MRPMLSRLLNGVTMYRLMLYYLGALLVLGLGLAFAGQLFVSPRALVFSALVITASAWATNRLFGYLLKLPLNRESVYITAMILILVMPAAAPGNLRGIAGLVLASVVAIGSKFLLTVGHKHIFNPVAIGAVASGVVLGVPAIWWTSGNLLMLAAVVIGGLLVTQKVQRFDMIGAYIAANLIMIALVTPPAMMGMAYKQGLLSSPLFFAGFAMLTEPMTAAHGKYARLIYGAIIGALTAPGVQIAGFFISPQLAFLVGNLFAWAASPKGRFRMTLLRIEQIASDCYEFIFAPDRAPGFQPGQYLDWTLHVPAPDNRGNRRSFTIASAPGEDHVRLGVKFYDTASAFKRQLLSLQPGDTIYGSQIAGTFTLPRDPDRKLLFIAGGIGITPFRSMIQDLLNRGERRDIVLLYGNRRAGDIAYRDLLDRARDEIGLRVAHVISDDPPEAHGHRAGFITEETIRAEVPDLAERLVYLSGPQPMVVTFRRMLARLGVARRRVRTDFFPGF